MRDSHKAEHMKAILTILFLTGIFAPPALAKSDFQLACSDETPTLGVVIREVPEDQTVVTELFAFQGMKVIYPSLANFPSYLRFEWPRQNCQKFEAYAMKCEHTSEIQTIEGHRVQALSMESFSKIEQRDGQQVLLRKTLLRLSVDGVTHEIHGEFSELQCSDSGVFRSEPEST